MTSTAWKAGLLIAAGAMLAACGGSDDPQPAPKPTPTTETPAATPAPTPTETPEATPTSEAPTPEATPASDSTPAATPVEEAVVETDDKLANLPAPYNTANYKKGRSQFAKCRSCHLVDEGAGHRVGPNLHGFFTRKVGEAEGFKYSKAVQEADFDWTPEQLDQWLANPKKFLPGNRMTFAGIANEEQRTNLIAYLLVETNK